MPLERPIFVPRLLGRRPELAALVAETIQPGPLQNMRALGRSVVAMISWEIEWDS
jgi:hypothetical protein